MMFSDWLSNNYIEIFGAVTGVIYVFLEIRQSTWLWPVGIVTSAVYIWIFLTARIYADMSLQGYYLIISCLGWYWWVKGAGSRAQDEGKMAQSSEIIELDGEKGRRGEREKREKENGRVGEGEKKERENGRMGERESAELQVTRLRLKTGVVLAGFFVVLYIAIWLVLTRLTDSPIPVRDSFVTSLSIIATWMLARKIYEHWFLWIAVNFVSAFLFLTRGLYPTVILYVVYGIMSFVGLAAWKKTIINEK